jgi:NADH-quinone oxidoreductase subunit J
MDMSVFAFYLLSAILVAGAFATISAKHPIYAVLSLIISFFAAACLWLLLDAEFLALTLILVYVGALMVLFLYVIMMLEINTKAEYSMQYLLFVLLLALSCAVEIIIIIVHNIPYIQLQQYISPAYISNANTLGFILYTQYAYPVELASVLLLLGLVVAVTLTLGTPKTVKRQQANVQILANAHNRLKLIKMSGEVS